MGQIANEMALKLAFEIKDKIKEKSEQKKAEKKEYTPRYEKITHEKDLELLRRTIEVSKEARASGNHPFGALLADEKGNILMEQGNCQVETGDCTGHAETTLMRRASMKYDKEFLWNCSLYTSCEPCVMCTGAIYWGNVGRIVYAMDEKSLLAMTGNNEENPTFNHPCRGILEGGQKDIVVNGPFPELFEEAYEAHKGFWD